MRGPFSRVSTNRRPARAGIACTVLLLAFALALPSTAAADEQFLRVKVTPTDYARSEYYLDNVVLADISGRDADAGWLEIIATEGDLPTLWLLGDIEILERSRPFREIQAERHAMGIDMPEEQYSDYTEVLEWMDEMVASNPAIFQKVNITTLTGSPQTEEGRDIYALKLSDNVMQDEDEQVILFDAIHHARELNTIEMVKDVGITLGELYGQHPLATAFVDRNEIWLVPVVNPDGLEYVWSTNNMWRKNRSVNAGSTCRGVDPNRNYSFLWGVCGNNSGNPCSGVYRGPAPLSEPEIQTMDALGEMLRPTINLSYHSFGREVLPPYACSATLAEPRITEIRESYRSRMNYAWRPASSSGESFEWFYNQTSSLAFLTEISNGFQPPFSETRTEIPRVRKGWIYLMELINGTGPLAQGLVTDSSTGLPVQADVTSTAVNFTAGERRACEEGYGRYSWFLPNGAQTLTFSAPGYQSKQVPVNMVQTGISVDVTLDPVP